MSTSNKPTIWERIDFIQSIKELNDNIGKLVYIVFEDDFIIGSSRKYEIDSYLEETNVLDKYIDDISKIDIIYGLVLNPKSLPKTSPKIEEGFDIYVIAPDNGTIDFKDARDLNEATKFIESLLNYDTDLTINDVALVYGIPIKMKLEAVISSKAIPNDKKKEFMVDGF